MLRLQRRLAASILNCGKNRIYISPSPAAQSTLAAVTSRADLRSLLKRGGDEIHKIAIRGTSKARHKAYMSQKRRGRHQGEGKRKGTANARMPEKLCWMRRQRVLRRLLKKYRETGKLTVGGTTKTLYREFYLKAKGNQYRNKRVLVEAIHKVKNEKAKQQQLAAQQEARKAKARSRKEAKNARRNKLAF